MYDSYKTVKVYSIVEEEVSVPVYQGHLEWHRRDQLMRLDAPFESTGRVYREPIHRFCENVYRGKYTDRYENIQRSMDLKNWEIIETFVAFRQSDRDGFMKYLTLLIDKARNDSQGVIDSMQLKIESLEKQLYHTQVNLECLDEKVSKATFWDKVKYLVGGELQCTSLDIK